MKSSIKMFAAIAVAAIIGFPSGDDCQQSEPESDLQHRILISTDSSGKATSRFSSDSVTVTNPEPEFRMPLLKPKPDPGIRFAMPHIAGDTTREYRMPHYRPHRRNREAIDTVNVDKQ